MKFLLPVACLCLALHAVCAQLSADDSIEALYQSVTNPMELNATAPVDYYGVDVSQPYDASHFKCLRAANLRFAVVRCYQSTGHVDPNCAGTVAAAHAGGMDRVDGYMFPCPTCGNAAGQVATLLSYFNTHNVNINTLWMDIEGTQYWYGDHNTNRAFMSDLLNASIKAGLKTGVYSSVSQWSGIFGSASWRTGSNVPLWYAHYDGNPSFSDFTSFGDWTHPDFKQFSDQGSKCGVSYDINWTPLL